MTVFYHEIEHKLPEFCYGTLRSTGEIILLKRGEMGFWKSKDQRPADELNATLGVTKAQRAAMEMGSMFGWNCTGADPDTYDEEGKPKRK